jgi:hypothetical protein
MLERVCGFTQAHEVGTARGLGRDEFVRCGNRRVRLSAGCAGVPGSLVSDGETDSPVHRQADSSEVEQRKHQAESNPYGYGRHGGDTTPDDVRLTWGGVWPEAREYCDGPWIGV